MVWGKSRRICCSSANLVAAQYEEAVASRKDVEQRRWNRWMQSRKPTASLRPRRSGDPRRPQQPPSPTGSSGSSVGSRPKPRTSSSLPPRRRQVDHDRPEIGGTRSSGNPKAPISDLRQRASGLRARLSDKQATQSSRPTPGNFEVQLKRIPGSAKLVFEATWDIPQFSTAPSGHELACQWVSETDQTMIEFGAENMAKVEFDPFERCKHHFRKSPWKPGVHMEETCNVCPLAKGTRASSVGSPRGDSGFVASVRLRSVFDADKDKNARQNSRWSAPVSFDLSEVILDFAAQCIQNKFRALGGRQSRATEGTAEERPGIAAPISDMIPASAVEEELEPRQLLPPAVSSSLDLPAPVKPVVEVQEDHLTPSEPPPPPSYHEALQAKVSAIHICFVKAVLTAQTRIRKRRMTS